MASRRGRPAKARTVRRRLSRAQLIWTVLSLLVLVALIVSTCAGPAFQAAR
jgi:hypothetical protein